MVRLDSRLVSNGSLVHLAVNHGATMFAQQMLNPQPADPMQAKVFRIMPIMFTVFMLFFPAGLVLYWIVNNSITILQQSFINKSVEKSRINKTESAS